MKNWQKIWLEFLACEQKEALLAELQRASAEEREKNIYLVCIEEDENGLFDDLKAAKELQDECNKILAQNGKKQKAVTIRLTLSAVIDSLSE